MIKDYIRYIAPFKNETGLRKSRLDRLDRIGRGRARYHNCSIYREIITQGQPPHGYLLSRQAHYKRYTFDPGNYMDMLAPAARARYIGHRPHNSVRNRLCVNDSVTSSQGRYGDCRGIMTINVDRDEDTGEFIISYNKSLED